MSRDFEVGRKAQWQISVQKQRGLLRLPVSVTGKHLTSTQRVIIEHRENWRRRKQDSEKTEEDSDESYDEVGG